MARLPVLMYHDIAADGGSGLTISTSNLEKQFNYLADMGYRCWSFSELAGMEKLPVGKNVVITFDDAYVSQLEYAVPLLKKYGLKATIFVPLQFIGGTDDWNSGKVHLMSWDQLRSLDPEVIELGCHSFGHISYRDSEPDAVAADLEKAGAMISGSGIKFGPVIAYPYGKFPREAHSKDELFKLMDSAGYRFACRIGNRVNRFPFRSPFEIQRLDIKGEYTMIKFRRKLKFGKLL